MILFAYLILRIAEPMIVSIIRWLTAPKAKKKEAKESSDSEGDRSSIGSVSALEPKSESGHARHYNQSKDI